MKSQCMEMDIAGNLFLCSMCGAQFPSALLLSQHSTTHQGYEFTPFCMGTVLHTGQSLLSQVPVHHLVEHNVVDRHPFSKKQSAIEATFTQLETVAPTARLGSSPLQRLCRYSPMQGNDDTFASMQKDSYYKLNPFTVNRETSLQPQCIGTNLNHPISESNQGDLGDEKQEVINVATSQVMRRNTCASSGTMRGEESINDVVPQSNNTVSCMTQCDWQSGCECEEHNLADTHQQVQGLMANIVTGTQTFSHGTQLTSDTKEVSQQIIHKGHKQSAQHIYAGTTIPKAMKPAQSAASLVPLPQQRVTTTPAIPLSAHQGESTPQVSHVTGQCAKGAKQARQGSFACEKCGKTFTLKSNLRQHEIYSHTDSRPFACTMCNKAFKLKGHLKDHERSAHTESRPFTCQHCKKSFKQKSHLTGHMAIHLGDKPHRCETCGRQFRQKQHMQRHALTHTSQRLFPCLSCTSAFNTMSDLKRHTRIHTGEKPYQCPLCGRGFARKQAAKTHLQIHMKPFTCQRCSKSFVDMQSLATHEKQHAKVLSHDCRECGSSFPSLVALKEHLQAHEESSQIMTKPEHLPYSKNLSNQSGKEKIEGRFSAVTQTRWKKVQFENQKSTRKPHNSRRVETKSNEKLSCSICKKMFVKHRLLQRHMHKCHGLEPPKSKRLECDQCHRSFRWTSLLQQHMIRAHNEKSYQCKACHKFFMEQYSFTKHQELCSKGDVGCDQCCNVFPSNQALQRHQMTAHGLRSFTCNVCSQTFVRKAALKRHELKHTSERPFPCVVCSKAFKERRQLRQHELIHRDERPYHCSQCGLSFLRKSYLIRHEATHSGLKRFPCPHCPSAFFMRHDLKRHLRIHCNEKPFSCNICKKTFRRKSAVAIHERQVHGKQFVCSFCPRKFHTRKELDAHSLSHCGVSGRLPALLTARSITGAVSDDATAAEERGLPVAVPCGSSECMSTRSVMDPDPDGDTSGGGEGDTGIGGRAASVSHSGESGSISPSIIMDDDVAGIYSKIHTQTSDRWKMEENRKTEGDVAKETPIDVTFYLCSHCGHLFPSALMLAKHTKALHQPSLHIDYVADRNRGKYDEHCAKGGVNLETEAGESVIPGNRDGEPVHTMMCVKCGEEYTGNSDAHLCVDSIVLPRGKMEESDEESESKDTKNHLVWDSSNIAEFDETLYYCLYCKKGFKRMGNLNVHKRLHTGEKPFVCRTCNKAFSIKSNLKQHELSAHTDARPYVCPTCPARFKQRSHLKSHQEIHSDIKKYECKICGQKFRQSSHLQRHQLIHAGIKLFKCEQCQSAFNLLSDLQRHARIHTGEKPFSCSYCNKAFRRKFQLKVHERHHTNSASGKCKRYSKTLETNLSQHINNCHTQGVCRQTRSKNDALKEHTNVHTAPSINSSHHHTILPEYKRALRKHRSRQTSLKDPSHSKALRSAKKQTCRKGDNKVIKAAK
ncbi:uncharacterized protein [Diadema setosum]|uniref:uncharacterized protein n=1 Tax=Diadema setosum TaxID=31175 RepID=UPI003B3A0014